MEWVATALYGLDLMFLLSLHVLNGYMPAVARPSSDYGLGGTARLFLVYLIAGCIAPPFFAWLSSTSVSVRVRVAAPET